MSKFLKLAGVVLVSSLFVAGAFTGCTQKPNQDELSKLDEAKAAAEGAEKKLSDLRQERIKLENDLQGTQSEVQKEEQELDGMQ